MFQRIYIHNYKCLQDFEWNLNDEKSLLLLGKNGTGKSSILSVLELLRDLALGKNLLEILLLLPNAQDITIFKFDVFILDKLYQYEITINVIDYIIVDEKLSVDSKQVFHRHKSDDLNFKDKNFMIDSAESVLSKLITKSEDVEILVSWLRKIILVSPNPSGINSYFISSEKKKYIILDKKIENLVIWLSDWLDKEPMLYSHIDSILRKIFPDFQRFKFDFFENSKTLKLIFGKDREKIEIPFDDLSDGERIIFLFSIILALMSHDEEPIFVFWDEPENYISLALLQSLIQFMRSKAEFSQQSHQVFFSSHNSEVINAFSSSHIYYLYRNTHITPTRICNVAEKGIENIIDELKYGELS